MMADKMQLECMDNHCRTVMVGHFLDGIRCVNCGGPVLSKLYNPVIVFQSKLTLIFPVISLPL